MGRERLFPLMVRMALPGLVSSMTTFFYTAINRKLLGDFSGTDALAAVGVLSPVNNIIAALSLFITIGGAALLALNMGRRDWERANTIFTNIICQIVLMGGSLTILFLTLTGTLVNMCGASTDTAMYPLAVQYLRILALGQIPNMMNVGLAAAIRAEGNARYSLFANVIGAILNLIVGYWLVARLQWGIRGAAIATVTGQTAGAIFSAAYFLRKSSALSWRGLGVVKFSEMLLISKSGVAPSIFQALGFTTNLIVNRSLQDYGGGELAIAGMSLVMMVDQLVVFLGAGINQAASPIISFNYGSRQYGRVRNASFLSQAMTFGITLLVYLPAMISPGLVLPLFGGSEAELLAFGSMAMRASKPLLLFTGYQMLVSMYFSAIGRPDVATLVSLLRNGIFLIPALVILPRFYGIMGVLYANPVSDGLSLVAVTVLYVREMRRIGRLADGESAPERRFRFRARSAELSE